MKKITLLFPLFLLLLLSSGCRDDMEGTSTSIIEPGDPIIATYTPDNVPVTGNVQGQVFNQDRGPVSNAVVRMGSLTTQTNEYGIFQFDNVTMNEKGTFITVERVGYFDGSRRFFPREGADNRIVIEMVVKYITPQFESSAGGTINIENSTATATFPANSIVDANGDLFEGTVHAATTWLDPTGAATFDQMPGNLQGVTQTLEEVALQTFGMVNVELSDENGAPLQIRTGYNATLSMPIPAQLTSAPDEIPLWSFSEQYGVWAEESVAYKQNGFYVGEVSHFSWWNCDAPFPLIELDLTLVDDEGNPLSFYGVGIGFEGDTSTWNYSYTNAEGLVSGKVPANENLTLFIRGLCGEILTTQNIGAFSEDTSLGNVTTNASTLNQTSIVGMLIDCNGNTLPNAGIIVRVDGSQDYSFTIENGAFDLHLSSCTNTTTMELIALDFENGLQTESIPLTVGETNDLGSIDVCDAPITESYLILTVGEDTHAYYGNNNFNVNDSQNGVTISYVLPDSLGGPQGGQFFMVDIGDTAPGDYSNNNTVVEILYDYSAVPPYNLYELDGSFPIMFETFIVTANDDEKISGYFSDSLENNVGIAPIQVQVDGEFYILK